MNAFEEKLERYAQLIVRHGLNVQEGQDVFIGTEPIHRDFAIRVVREAYRAGARTVLVDLQDPRVGRIRLEESKKEEYLEHVPANVPFQRESLLPEHGATLKILGSEFPDILSDLDPKKVNRVQSSIQKSMKKFFHEGIGLSKVHWNIAAAATPAWGEKVFPELKGEAACEALWEEIFKMCRADQPNCLEFWKEHNEILHARSKKLTEMKIKYLHFTGPGTDLKVGLSPTALFTGGTSLSARNVPFEPNLPTEECFTTPDYRMTEGKAKVTRPFLIGGKQIRGLNLEFKEGKIVNFSAEEGADTFGEAIESDSGAKYLGEVALVGIDSPIYQSGRVFEEILFDENACCHIAIGFAYRFCIDGSDKMSDEELEQVGCNTSCVHTDMMISSDEVDVTAECYDGKSIPLIKKGEWI